MLADLEALTPPLIMAAAFLIGVAFFLRRQLSPRGRSADEDDRADISGSGSNAGLGDTAHGSSAEQHKV